jgi:hypothetical protein
MLHIHNGESTANTMREFGFPGEHFAFQEVLLAGPTPRGLSREDWRETRAKYLSEAYDLSFEESRSNLVKQEAALGRFTDHDETILWFEHDLFCQINLIYLLDWFAQQPEGKTKLSLICIGEFPGIEDFRGLGQLTGAQMTPLFNARRAITDRELEIATRAWGAYCAPDPRGLVRLTAEDTSAMPFLRNALRLHLERFPSRRNGLGRVENQALELILPGAITFKSLFPRFAKAEPVYGLGDWQFWNEMERLVRAGEPLLKISGLEDGELAIKSSICREASFELTEAGRAVLASESDFIELNGIDLWLGGVHLADGKLWRWDERSGDLADSSECRPI